jgi:putative colanic acid biosynthesis UDP-glucose lipid carrier transferase
LSLIFSAGLVAFSHDFDNRLVTYLCWYLLTSVGMVVCRSPDPLWRGLAAQPGL